MIRIIISSLSRNNIVDIDDVIKIQKNEIQSFSTTLDKRKEQNSYSVELTVIAKTLSILLKLRFRNITLTTRNKAVVLTLRRSY